jgi:hypothetical protein
MWANSGQVNMSYLKIISFVVTILLACISHAGEVTSDWIKIDQIKLGWNVNRVTLQFIDPIPNPYGCYQPTTAAIDEDHVNLDHLYSLALTQFAANKEIQLVVYDDRCSYSNRIKILSIYAR